jgi:hypothetical protein
MNIPLPTIAAPAVCKMLRTKNAYSRSNERDPNVKPWQFGESTTAAFWCLKTMQPAGPDDHYAHPSVCLNGRACYQAGE